MHSVTPEMEVVEAGVDLQLSSGLKLAYPVSTRVPTDQFRTAQLPPVCIYTGAPADHWMPMSVKSRIGAQWLLLLIGIVAFVIVRAVTIKRAAGFLPINRVELARLTERVMSVRKKRSRRLFRAFAIVAVLTACVGFTVGTGWIIYQWSSEAAELQRKVEAAQKAWDQVASALPMTDFHYGSADSYTTDWSLNPDGCIESTDKYDDVADSYRSSSDTYCRPKYGGLAGIGLKMGNPQQVVIDVGSTSVPSLNSDDSESMVGVYEWVSTSADLNIAAPLVGGIVIPCVVLGVGLLVIGMGGPKRPRAPRAWLDRSGERVVFRSHPEFARRAAAIAMPAPGLVGSPTNAGAMWGTPVSPAAPPIVQIPTSGRMFTGAQSTLPPPVELLPPVGTAAPSLAEDGPTSPASGSPWWQSE